MKKSKITALFSIVLAALIPISPIYAAGITDNTTTSQSKIVDTSKNSKDDTNVILEVKNDAKTSDNEKTSQKPSFPNVNGIKNIVDHPFRIIGR